MTRLFCVLVLPFPHPSHECQILFSQGFDLDLAIVPAAPLTVETSGKSLNATGPHSPLL